MSLGRFGLLLVVVSSFFLCSQAQLMCGSLPDTDGNNGTTRCFCVSGFYWTGLACQRNCSTALIPNSRGSPFKRNICYCKRNFVWDGADCSSSLNCTQSVANAVEQDGPSSCICDTGYYWTGVQCDIVDNRARGVNCTNINNTNGKKNFGDCFCISGFFWDGLQCQFNCSNITGSTGRNAAPIRCQCLVGFTWNQENLECAAESNNTSPNDTNGTGNNVTN